MVKKLASMEKKSLHLFYSKNSSECQHSISWNQVSKISFLTSFGLISFSFMLSKSAHEQILGIVSGSFRRADSTQKIIINMHTW
jgi:hypothetical protein